MATRHSLLIFSTLTLSLLTGLPGVSYADNVSVEEIEVGDGAYESTPGEKAANAWATTRETAGEAAEYGAEKGSQAWDATVEATQKGADYVGDKSSQAWDATKVGTAKAIDATTEAAGKAWSKTREVTHDAVEYTSDKLDAMGGDASSGEPAVVERSLNND